MTRFLLFLIALTTCALSLPIAAAGTANVLATVGHNGINDSKKIPGPALAPHVTLRYSVSDEKIRFVLDLPGDTAFSDQSTPRVKRLTVEALPEQTTAPITINDPLVSGVTLADAGGKAVLTVTLAHARKAEVFTLPAGEGKPCRLVLDILKSFSSTARQTLTPAIQYIHLERQQGDRYLSAHLLQIDAQDTHVHFAVASAAGAREVISAMVPRLHAVAGINGGYFQQGTRPVGLLKADGTIITLPIWGRAAVAFPVSGTPIFANPAGCWRVMLPDGSTRDLPDYTDASIRTPLPTARVLAGASQLATPALPPPRATPAPTPPTPPAVITHTPDAPATTPSGTPAAIPPTPQPDAPPPAIQPATPPEAVTPPAVPPTPAPPQPFIAIIRDGKVLSRPTVSTHLERTDFALLLSGDDAKALDAALPVGAPVSIAPILTTPDWGGYTQAVGAGPRLLQAGAVAITGSAEHFPADILTGHRARTGLGVTADGKVLLAVVEEPGPYGGGATLEELAKLLKEFGAVNAINLDGGGSSILAIGDKAVNYPPNSFIRPVACGVLVFDDRLPVTAIKP